LLVAVAFTAATAQRAGAFVEALGVLGALGCLLLAAGLGFGWPRSVFWALVTLGSQYVGALSTAGRPFDPWAPLFGGGLFLAAELAYWALELEIPSRAEPGLRARRARRIAALTLGSTALSGLLVLLATVPLAGSLVLTAGAVVAAVAALALVAAVAWRGRPPERDPVQE